MFFAGLRLISFVAIPVKNRAVWTKFPARFIQNERFVRNKCGTPFDSV